MRQRESSLGVAWGARRKPGLASPANMSKRGLSARHSVPNQTLSLVNFRLPKGNVAAPNPGRPGGYGLGPGFHARKVAWAGWSPRPSRRPFGGLPQTPDGRIRLRVLAANCARGLLEELLALPFRGRREDRVLAAPAVSRAICANKNAHEHTGQREHSGLPCAMALRLTSCSPRRTALLPPSPPRSLLLENFAPAPRRQDHTT